MTERKPPDEPQAEGKFEPARIKSPDELKEVPDAGSPAPKGCDFNNRYYKNDEVRRGGPGKQYRCKDGQWVEESLLDPTDPWQ
jgi:hypothetical protein